MRVLSPMYRGSRMGDPRKPSGPAYFTSSKHFAATYGPVAAFEVVVRKPLIVDDNEWGLYASSFIQPTTDIAKKLKRRGYDSVINTRITPSGDELIVLLLVDSRNAKVL